MPDLSHNAIYLPPTINTTKTIYSLCHYVSPEGYHCEEKVENNSLCFWHDPSISKEGEDVKLRLEAWAATGKPMTGFCLKRADLQDIKLINEGQKTGLNLAYADLYRANLRHAHLFHIDLHGASLMKAHVEGANLNCANLEDANLLGTQFKHTKIEHINWGNRLKQENAALSAEKENDCIQALDYFEQAEEIYRNLRRISEDKGLTEQAGYFFHREMVMRRYQIPRYSLRRFLSKTVDLLCGYGEKPRRVLFFSLLFICICASLYFILGIQTADSIIQFNSHFNWRENIINFIDCLYFSIVTFTTLGYGDISPVGMSRIIAAVEAFTGSFTTALFVVVFVKKMTR